MGAWQCTVNRKACIISSQLRERLARFRQLIVYCLEWNRPHARIVRFIVVFDAQIGDESVNVGSSGVGRPDLSSDFGERSSVLHERRCEATQLFDVLWSCAPMNIGKERESRATHQPRS